MSSKITTKNVLLTLTQTQEDLLKVAQADTHTGAGFIDIENIKRDVAPETMVEFNSKLKEFVHTETGREIKLSNAVGCIDFFLGPKKGKKGEKRDPWDGTIQRDVAARYRKCPLCLSVFYGDSVRSRTAVAYEQVADVADDEMEQYMFSDVRFNGIPYTMVIITGDADFIRPIKILRLLNVFVILIKPREWSLDLKDVANREFDLSEITPYAGRSVSDYD